MTTQIGQLTHEDAVQWLEHIQVALQKVRSIAKEELDYNTLVYINPWLYKDDSPLLLAVSRILERVAEGAKVAPMDFYNITYLLDRYGVEVDGYFISQQIEARPELDTVVHCITNGWYEPK